MSLSDLMLTIRGIGKRGERATTDESKGAVSAAQGPVGAGTEASVLPPGIAREIDVSQLPPPLPMVRILDTLQQLGPGQTLLVHNRRRPIHLYPKLDALGCTHETSEPEPGKIEVRITKPTAESS